MSKAQVYYETYVQLSDYVDIEPEITVNVEHRDNVEGGADIVVSLSYDGRNGEELEEIKVNLDDMVRGIENEHRFKLNLEEDVELEGCVDGYVEVDDEEVKELLGLDVPGANVMFYKDAIKPLSKVPVTEILELAKMLERLVDRDKDSIKRFIGMFDTILSYYKSFYNHMVEEIEEVVETYC